MGLIDKISEVAQHSERQNKNAAEKEKESTKKIENKNKEEKRPTKMEIIDNVSEQPSGKKSLKEKLKGSGGVEVHRHSTGVEGGLGISGQMSKVVKPPVSKGSDTTDHDPMSLINKGTPEVGTSKETALKGGLENKTSSSDINLGRIDKPINSFNVTGGIGASIGEHIKSKKHSDIEKEQTKPIVVDTSAGKSEKTHKKKEEHREDTSVLEHTHKHKKTNEEASSTKSVPDVSESSTSSGVAAAGVAGVAGLAGVAALQNSSKEESTAMPESMAAAKSMTESMAAAKSKSMDAANSESMTGVKSESAAKPVPESMTGAKPSGESVPESMTGANSKSMTGVKSESMTSANPESASTAAPSLVPGSNFVHAPVPDSAPVNRSRCNNETCNQQSGKSLEREGAKEVEINKESTVNHTIRDTADGKVVRHEINEKKVTEEAVPVSKKEAAGMGVAGAAVAGAVGVAAVGAARGAENISSNGNAVQNASSGNAKIGSSAPEKRQYESKPECSKDSGLFLDRQSGQILYEADAYKKRYFLQFLWTKRHFTISKDGIMKYYRNVNAKRRGEFDLDEYFTSFKATEAKRGDHPYRVTMVSDKHDDLAFNSKEERDEFLYWLDKSVE